jgi:hypothetical protein
MRDSEKGEDISTLVFSPRVHQLRNVYMEQVIHAVMKWKDRDPNINLGFLSRFQNKLLQVTAQGVIG